MSGEAWMGAERREGEIHAALARCAARVDRPGRRRWAFVLSNGTDLAVRARLDDGWLSLDAPVGPAHPSPALDCRALLRRNATLAGGARFALSGLHRRLRLRADVPLDDGVDVYGRVVEACAGLTSAGGPVRDEDEAAASGAADADLAGLCRQTSWEFVERGSRLAVTLDVPGAFQQATVEPRGRGVVVAVPVLDVSPAERATDLGARAMGLLLLRTCGVVRLARAAGSLGDGDPLPRFEAVFRDRPDPMELAHAFAALSLACRLAAREAAVLWSDDSVARIYLERWGSSEGGFR